MLGETDRHAETLIKMFGETPASGNLAHDLHIAVILREHGVSEIITADADFHRFKGFRVTLLGK